MIRARFIGLAPSQVLGSDYVADVVNHDAANVFSPSFLVVFGLSGDASITSFDLSVSGMYTYAVAGDVGTVTLTTSGHGVISLVMTFTSVQGGTYVLTGASGFNQSGNFSLDNLAIAVPVGVN